MNKFTCQGSNSFVCQLAQNRFAVFSGTILSVLFVVSSVALWYSESLVQQQVFSEQFYTVVSIDLD